MEHARSGRKRNTTTGRPTFGKAGGPTQRKVTRSLTAVAAASAQEAAWDRVEGPAADQPDQAAVEAAGGLAGGTATGCIGWESPRWNLWLRYAGRASEGRGRRAE